MISFRPVTMEDLPLLSDWMARPHWREWWGDPTEELGYVREMLTGQDTTRPYFFQIDGKETGYIQVWFIKDQKNTEWVEDYPWLELLPDEAVGVDLSIASAADLSKGIGTRVLSAFVEKLRREGYDRIIIDPDPANLRAVNAYRKAGFREIEDLLGRTDDCLLMEHNNEEGVS
ncbi:Aminoglycoside N(6')-acetyltransferase type 1 [Labrenzia sp. THAF82]|uniref:GNAT family N-acetyltransferase n=1 Tax=Labrenzia sp. THAF82 TaxID=2587861 RepID=UPI0012697761|nr:GNAT family N-acetyltransferase [Labrenzia sp. THAF82]QFT34805.1 Aminoglycoside N(6')-acetyltransferase type 1 [Labrenzia sp. THAF82]